MGWFSKYYPLVRFDVEDGSHIDPLIQLPYAVLKLYNESSPVPVTPMQFTYKLAPYRNNGRRPLRCGVLLYFRRDARKVVRFLDRSRDFAYLMTDSLARNSADIIHWLSEEG
jgi:hypothetical protein